MTNLEYFKDELIQLSKIKEFTNDPFIELYRRHGPLNSFCYQNIIEWLCDEHKKLIKLSLVEKMILENLDPRYKWLAMDKSENLYLYIEKPYKRNILWSSRCGFLGIMHFPNLFKFIKWEDEEPINIKELLENCVVEEELIKKEKFEYDLIKAHMNGCSKKDPFMSHNVLLKMQDNGYFKGVKPRETLGQILERYEGKENE